VLKVEVKVHTDEEGLAGSEVNCLIGRLGALTAEGKPFFQKDIVAAMPP